jgi:capsular exopolysaccharide synthesis family protein
VNRERNLADLVVPGRKTLESPSLAAMIREDRPVPTFEETVGRTDISPAPVAEAVLDSGSLVSEEFRMLRAQVQDIAQQRPFRCFGLVSSAAGEGKTTVALGLAAALAQMPDRRVLLVEADLRKPAIETTLGLPPAPGLSEWLEGTNGSVVVRRLLSHRFFLLTAGQSDLKEPERLGSERMAGLLDAARATFDSVVVDCPPLVPVADSVMLQDLLDGFVYVVRARHTPREAVLKAMSRLRPDRIQGVVFNARRDILPSYSDFGYRRYGKER